MPNRPPEAGSDGSSAGDGAINMPPPSDGALPPPPPEDGGHVQSPEGFVPVFMAVGYQSHRIISCDQGVTWGHEAMSATGGGDDPTLMRGLAYGKNRFVSAVGGGGSQQLWTTEDGFNWTVIKRNGNGYSDVTFGGDRFVAGGGHISVISFDGLTWQMDGTMGEGGILRSLAYTNYMGGRFAAAGDSGRRMNSKDGVTWGHQFEEGSSLNRIAGGNGVFVAIAADGTTRYSTDGGDSWSKGNVGTGGVRGIAHDGQKFVITADSGSYFSSNGVDWESKGGDPGPYDFASNDDRTHYAGADGNILLHSTDAIHWKRVHDGGPNYERVKFGFVKPSADACPAP
jgi:hypothetical protein